MFSYKFAFVKVLMLSITLTACENGGDKGDEPAPTSPDIADEVCYLTDYDVDNGDYREQYSYDSKYRLVKGETTDNGEIISYSTYSYDQAGRPMQRDAYRPDGTRYGYTTYTYNESNLLVKEQYLAVEEAEAHTNSYTTYEYNAAGKVTRSSRYVKWGTSNDYRLQLETLYGYNSQNQMNRVQTRDVANNISQPAVEYDYEDDYIIRKSVTGRDTYTVYEYGDVKNPTLPLLQKNPFYAFSYYMTPETYMERMVKKETIMRDGKIVKEAFVPTYEVNERGYPIKAFTRNDVGEQTVVYDYDCP